MFLDESGFLLIPNVRKTWAPIGCTPTVRHSYRRDKLSAISAVSVSPAHTRVGLYMHLHPDNITGAEVVVFLRNLLRHLRGPIELLWDGGSIHKREDVKAFLSRNRRLIPHRFPAYAPELNPDEFVSRLLESGPRRLQVPTFFACSEQADVDDAFWEKFDVRWLPGKLDELVNGIDGLIGQ